MKSILEINSLILPVYIGYYPQERQKKQNISFTITLGYLKKPLAETTDTLQGSVCYLKICEKINTLISKKSFCLIEKLSYDTFTMLKKWVPSYIGVRVCVHKINPPVAHLKGGVFYTCGDTIT